MKFNLKSKSSLFEDVKEALLYTKIPFEVSNEQTLQVQVEDERTEEFLFLVSFSMAYYAFRKIVLEELVRMKVDNDLNLELYKEASIYFQSTQYWIAMTTVWVDDHFSSNQEINMDTFPLFNMKGFKQEVKTYTKFLIDDANGETYGTSLLPEAQIGQVGDLEAIIKERVTEKQLDLTMYETIHLYESEEGFGIVDNKGNEMTDAFFIEELEFVFHINVANVDIETNHYHNIILLSFFINTLATKTLHVHLHDEFSLEVLNEGKISFPSQLTIIECQGCSSCE